MHYWVDLQSVHGFCCYDNIALRGFAIGAHDNIAANAKCQRVLVLALCLVYLFANRITLKVIGGFSCDAIQ